MKARAGDYDQQHMCGVVNTAAIAVATGNDFTHETVKHVIVKVRFLQECVQEHHQNCVHQEVQEYCGYHDQTICWTTIRAAS
jgi:hypothetical protein